MNMKKWMTPTAIKENFAADNTVSSCYKIACNTEAANSVEKHFIQLDMMHITIEETIVAMLNIRCSLLIKRMRL